MTAVVLVALAALSYHTAGTARFVFGAIVALLLWCALRDDGVTDPSHDIGQD